MDNTFLQVGIVFILSTLLGVFIRFFKQPLILAYIFAGLALSAFGLSEKLGGEGILPVLSQFGVAFLLFMVGMELKISDLKQVGKASIVIGLGQVILTLGSGFLISSFLGFSTLASIYIAIALTLSSTIIIIKLLLEKNDLNSLYGKITIGVLLFQDLVAISILILLSGFKMEGGSPQLASLFLIFLKGLIVIFIVSVLSKKFIPYIFQISAKNQELLFLLAVSWCFLFASGSYLLGFSLEIGAFLAGLSLSNLPYHYQISSRIKPLRDLFAALFFASLGMNMTSLPGKDLLVPMVIFVLFVLVLKPLIIMVIMGFSGFRKRTSFLTASSLGQISEFSLILLGLGLSLGHITSQEVSMLIGVGVVAIILSTYVIFEGQWFYAKLETLLSFFEKRVVREQKFSSDKTPEAKVILIGCNRTGSDVLEFLKKKKEPYLVLDFNPEVIKALEDQQVPCLFGDMSDEEILDHLNLDKAKIIISTVTNFEDNLSLIKKAKSKKSKALILITAAYSHEEEELYGAGADYVIVPHLLGGKHIAHILTEHFKDLDAYLSSRKEIAVS